MRRPVARCLRGGDVAPIAEYARRERALREGAAREGEFILPAVPDAARTAVVDRRQLTGKMKSPALEKNTIGTASPRRTKVLTLAKASSVILGRCENAVTTPNHIRSFAIKKVRRAQSAPAAQSAPFAGADLRRCRRRKRRTFARTKYALCMVSRAPPPAQTAARPARPPAAYGAHPAPPEPENGAPRARNPEFSSKSHHILVAPSYPPKKQSARVHRIPPPATVV